MDDIHKLILPEYVKCEKTGKNAIFRILEAENEVDIISVETDCLVVRSKEGKVFYIKSSTSVLDKAKTIEERKHMGLEEERRLCYVAITRAQKRLFFLDSEGYTQNGKQKLPSRFLKEIGEENYIRIGTISRELQYSADQYAASLLGEPVTQPPRVTGARVTHPAFGEGQIMGFGRNQNTYRVKFDKLASERDISVEFFQKRGMVPAQIAPPQRQEERSAPAVENGIPQGYEKKDEFTLQTRQEQNKTETTDVQASQPQTKRPDLTQYDNLWKREDVPKSGWVCTGVTDLGAPVGVCEMCGHQIIRYVHHMQHPNYRSLNVGCICAGKMEGNIEQAKKREQDFKSKQVRKESFKNGRWKMSKNSNSYIKVRDHVVVLYHNKIHDNWKFSLDNVFCPEVYATREEAMDAAFEALES